MKTETRIAEALGSLLLRENDDSFVIIEERHTGKFVQFVKAETDSLLLDLPLQTLSEEEVVRAQRLFTSVGVPGPETWEVFDLAGRPAGTQSGFQMAFGDDPEAAARMAMRIFTWVYRFPEDVELVFKEN